MRTVFLSSTGRDLNAHREAVHRAIESLDDWKCVWMENFGARDWEADEFCRARVTECDVFVGILGHCYGSCPAGKEQSYTEREYDAAVAAKKPRLMFFAPEDFPLPAYLIEPDEKRQKQRAFRDQVSGERIRDTFSSPEDLAWRVVRAIHNWEQEHAAAQERPAAVPAGGLRPLPPQPYFAHPYPLQEHFTGRVSERKMLTGWLTKGEEPVLALVAIGGMGKSALTWVWVQRDVLGLPVPGVPREEGAASEQCRVPEGARPEGVLWWSFYDRESTFERFLDEAPVYLSGGKHDPRSIPSTHEKMQAVYSLLRERRFLVVLDGVERILRAYARMDAPYRGDEVEADQQGDFRSCVDPHAGDFLKWLAGGPMNSRVVLTSRLFPRDLEDMAGCCHEELASMDPEDAVAFFCAQGVKGTRAEIQSACAPYGYLPLALRLLAGVIVRDKRTPGDIRVADRHPVLPELKGKEHHHILQVAYDEMDEEKRTLLSKIAAFRSPMTYDALAVFNPYGNTDEFDAALDELIARGLLLFDQGRGLFDMHPIVRQHAYDRLADKVGTHTRLRDYFARVPAPDRDKVESLEDLAPTIELYHHTVRAGRYDEACALLYERLVPNPLHFRFGAYQLMIELKLALFPDGEDHPPRLKRESDQAWTLNALANSCSLAGQSRRAVPLFEMHNALREKAGDAKDIATGLENLADDHLKLGQLHAAEGSLRRRIELCREIKDPFPEAVGHAELARLLAYQGAFDEAAPEMHAALDTFARGAARQSECVVWAYRALRALLMGNADEGLEPARRAHEIACGRRNERDRIRAEWLLGWAFVALASKTDVGAGVRQPADSAQAQPRAAVPHGSSGAAPLLGEAETHLTEALTRCRRINMVDHEPDILLAWARWHHAKGDSAPAQDRAREALTVADRCEYRLNQADIHNFLALLALEAGDRETARKHAETARERALCDGPPHCYKPALDEADRLLQQIASHGC
jgi:tetratricopeptide (TPR) repeat protein